MPVILPLGKAVIPRSPIWALPLKEWNRAVSTGTAELIVIRLVLRDTQLKSAPVFCQPNLIIRTQQRLSKTQIFCRLAETPSRTQHCHEAG